METGKKRISFPTQNALLLTSSEVELMETAHRRPANVIGVQRSSDFFGS